MMENIKKGIGTVVGIYLGFACTAMLNGALLALVKKEDKPEETEPKTEEEAAE